MDATGERRKLEALDLEELYAAVGDDGGLPRHVAVIMDGNGRWARRRFLPRVAGHRAGRHAVRACVTAAGRLGLEVLTLYTFSQENFNRPDHEVRALWSFLEESLAAEQEGLDRRGVRLRACGDLDHLPAPARARLQMAMDTLQDNTGLVLNLALAYGGRQEILQAALDLHERIARGELDPAAATEEDFAEGLYTAGLPDPDLVVRTSGEMRLSNFLPWQSAYAEILVTPTLWPDFREREFLLAVADYQGRERRFGALPDTADKETGEGGGSMWDAARWKSLLRVRQ